MESRKRGRPSTLTDLDRKRNKMLSDKDRRKKQVFIGDHIDRWQRVKEDIGFYKDHDVAGFLLDR